MKSDRLMIWRFAAAPKPLQSLHYESETPEWLVLIPRALGGADLDEAILQGFKPGGLSRYETPEGDIVYVGTSRLDRLSLGRPDHPPVRNGGYSVKAHVSTPRGGVSASLANVRLAAGV